MPGSAPLFLSKHGSTVHSRLLLLLLALSLPPTLPAQPVPKLTSLSPDHVQRGTSLELTVQGENLTNASALWFSVDPELRPGGIAAADLKSSDGKTLTAKLNVAADAAPGERELRLVTPAGISEPLLLNVSDLPELRGAGTNTSAEAAQAVQLPVALSSKIAAAAEVDYYRFHGAKGQRLTFEVFAARIGSPLDSSLAVLSLEGKELARNEDSRGLDSFLEFEPAEDADFLLSVRDFRYLGGNDFKYRLCAGSLPCIDWLFPPGGQRGTSVEIALAGRNLGDTKAITKMVAPDATPGISEIMISANGHFSNAKAFEIGSWPEFTEIEPNDSPESANTIPVPITINGRISGSADMDLFKFHIDREQRLICEVQAQKLESPLDALLSVKDSQGKVVAQNDDNQGMDPRIDFTFGKDQDYLLTLGDLNQRGGSNFIYRLSIHPVEPDFVVRFFPDTPRINRGGHTRVRCEVTRLGDFRGPVRVAFESLPAGIYCEPQLLDNDPPGTGMLVLSAASDAALGHFPLKLNASATIKGALVSHSGEPIIPGQKTRRGRRNTRLSEDRLVDNAYLTVLDNPPFLIDLISLAAQTDQDHDTSIELRVQRSPGFTNDIELTAEGYSTDREPITKNLEDPKITIPADQTRVKLKLAAKSGAETGTRTVIIKGAATNATLNPQYSTALPLTIRPIPFTLASSLPRLAITALPVNVKSAAGEAIFSVKADRRQGFNGEITLSLEGLPEGVASTFEKIPAGQSEATIKLTAGTNAPVGKEISFTFEGSGLFSDRYYKQRTPPVKLTINASEETVTAASK